MDLFIFNTHMHISSLKLIAISASDGIYDVISAEKVVQYLGQSLFENHMSPQEACERLIREASRLWKNASIGGMQYRDDITIGVSKINLVETGS